MLIDKRLPDPRPWLKAEAERKKQDLLASNRRFGLTVCAALVSIFTIATAIHYVITRDYPAGEYSNPIRADLTSLVKALR